MTSVFFYFLYSITGLAAGLIIGINSFRYPVEYPRCYRALIIVATFLLAACALHAFYLTRQVWT